MIISTMEFFLVQTHINYSQVGGQDLVIDLGETQVLNKNI